MKDYTIWLVGGSYISGQVKEEECKNLENAFVNRHDLSSIDFDDQDGHIALDPKQIIAVYYGDPPKINYNQVGFGPPGSITPIKCNS